MRPISKEEQARVTRAAMAYAGINYAELEEISGIGSATLRRIASHTEPRGADAEQVVAIASATKVPVWFMYGSFAAVEELSDLLEGMDIDHIRSEVSLMDQRIKELHELLERAANDRPRVADATEQVTLALGAQAGAPGPASPADIDSGDAKGGSRESAPARSATKRRTGLGSGR